MGKAQNIIVILLFTVNLAIQLKIIIIKNQNNESCTG